MSSILTILGCVVTVVGLLLVVTASFVRPPAPAPPGQEAFDPGQIKEIIEAFNGLLDKLESRYRIGVTVMAFGLALIGIGAYLEARDAKDEAEEAAAPAVLALF
jgi:hypothetical protein